MNKKRIVREWLYFVGFLPVGFFVVPFILFIAFGTFFDEFYQMLFGYGYFGYRQKLLPWFTVLVGPYLVFLFIRSVIWAWKMVKKPGE